MRYIAEIESIPSREVDTPSQGELSSFHATMIEATALSHGVLWENRRILVGGGVDNSWNLEQGQRIRPMIVDTLPVRWDHCPGCR